MLEVQGGIKMIKTISFTYNPHVHNKSIDTKMNEWLEENPNIEVINTETSYHKREVVTTTVRLLYKELK